jgi:hypothetical protein
MVYLYTTMVNAWYNNEDNGWMGTDDAREIWSTLIDYLTSRSHEQRLAEDRDEIKNWYLDIWDIVDKGETTPPPAFDNIVGTIYGAQFYRNITEDTLASIFNIAPVSIQYQFISALVNENGEEENNYIADQPQMHYAGETYGDYDSEREPEDSGRVFEWPNEEENSAETDNEGDSESDDETDSEIDSIPALVSTSDTESDDEGYETDATVIVDNDDSDDSDEIDRTELRTNVWHEIEYPWQHFTTPRQYFVVINGYAYHSEDELDAETETDCESMPELLTPSDTDTSDEEEEHDNNGRRVLQRTAQRIARTVRV